MNLHITSAAPPLTESDVRRALVASDDLAAILRMRARGWRVETDGVRVTGRRGPAFVQREWRGRR